MTPRIVGLDHIVLNVRDVERSLQFYTGVLGLQPERLEEFRAGKAGFPSVRVSAETVIDLFPSAPYAGAGGVKDEKADGNLRHFCMVMADEDFEPVLARLAAHGVRIREGPVARWGARGMAVSIYFLDPDGNEIELRRY
ncbi:MAG TPA: VOC family protein [candidate division Zixibacteria bacterium]|nr:VOC family protein [candidate division Zixibacteria bacterium]